METLRERRGGNISGLTGGGGGGVAAAMMRPLMTVVVSQGECRVAGEGGVTCVVLLLTCGMLCLRMLPGPLRWSRLAVLRCCGVWPFIFSESFLAAACTRLIGVTVGVVRYFCL